MYVEMFQYVAGNVAVFLTLNKTVFLTFSNKIYRSRTL